MLAPQLTLRLPSHPVTITTHDLSQGRKIRVVRDDLLSGGTKQRAAGQYLREMRSRGHTNFLYASPFSGFAQVALAVATKELGMGCVLVCEKDQRFPEETRLHPFSEIARSHGAEIVLAKSLEHAEKLALDLAERIPELMKVPLGFDCPEFHHHLGEEIELAWFEMPQDIETVWVSLGSGTLTRAMRKALPSRVRIGCLNVHVLPDTDPRIEAVRRLPNVEVYSAPMTFHTPAAELPPLPSNLYYDAKLWELLHLHAGPRDLWWNVAR